MAEAKPSSPLAFRSEDERDPHRVPVVRPAVATRKGRLPTWPTGADSHGRQSNYRRSGDAAAPSAECERDGAARFAEAAREQTGDCGLMVEEVVS